MGFNIGPRVVRATGGGITRVGNYRIHQFPPQHITDGLVLMWDMADPVSYSNHLQTTAGGSGTTVKDLSGNGNNGTVNGGPSFYTTFGGSVVFDGSNDEIVSAAGVMDSSDGSMTFECWVRQDTNQPVHGGLMGLAIDGDTPGNYHFGTHGQNGVRYFALISDGSGYTTGATSPDYANDSWNHIVYTNDQLYGINGGIMRMFSNGTQHAQTAHDRDGNMKSTMSVRFGKDFRYAQGASGRMWKGQMGVCRAYNRALSAEEIYQNYQAEKVRYVASGTSSTDNFTPTCSGNGGRVEVLAVAGGGAGGSGYANGNGVGGGGAGGVVYNSSVQVTNETATVVTVGMGGTGSVHNDNNSSGAATGQNSSFGTAVVATGGGAGGNAVSRQGGNGGSGGGGGSSAGTAVSGQGNVGGVFYNTSGYYRGGGGGGAGGVGVDGSSVPDGGAGVVYSITGSPVAYAGGGGGAAWSGGNDVARSGGNGGSGIGGNGADGDGTSSSNDPGANGKPDTGSGGGGSTWPSTSGDAGGRGGSGGNGTVVVRYPAEDYNAELLIVAGGGGGGACHTGDAGGGGGGAGGLLYYSSVPISSGKSYLIRNGQKGYGSTSSSIHGYNGGDSIFGDKIAIGGGGGGSTRDTSSTKNGGSGGAAGSDQSPNTGGFGTDGQGHKGGNNTGGSTGAGGGGAGEAGGDAPNSNIAAKPGGDGLAYSITGSSVTYAGGGGGGKWDAGSGGAGAGGAGGGGAGGKGDHGSAGTANTGGGGGGGGMISGGASKNGGDGGSGIIILAYKGPQRGEGGTIDQTSRPGYTLHKFTDSKPYRFIG